MCIASLKSMTMAMKAKKALNEAFIECEIIKLDPYMTKKGCAYGIKFNCTNMYSVIDILDEKRVKYSEIIRL